MFQKIRCFTFFAVLFAFIAAGVAAQTPTELRIGTPISGNLREGDAQWFNFRPTATGFLTVETTGDTDTYLEAYDSSGNLIMENDDGGEDFNAKIWIFITANQTYRFKLRGYSDSVSGPFVISAKFENISNATELRFGAVSASLHGGENHWYTVRPAGDGILTVETSGDIDTFLEAYNFADGTLIDADDDGGEDLNAKLEIIVEPGKTYLFRLRGYSDFVSGPYNIWASFEPIAPDTERNTARSRAIPLRLGEPIPVFLRAPSESRWYSFNVPRVGLSLVVQTRGNIDTMLFLYDAHGNLIAEDDDSGEGLNAMISQRLGPGTVFIEVKGYSNTTGRFTLHGELR